MWVAGVQKVFEKLEGNLAKLMEIDAEELEQKVKLQKLCFACEWLTLTHVVG